MKKSLSHPFLSLGIILVLASAGMGLVAGGASLDSGADGTDGGANGNPNSGQPAASVQSGPAEGFFNGHFDLNGGSGDDLIRGLRENGWIIPAENNGPVVLGTDRICGFPIPHEKYRAPPGFSGEHARTDGHGNPSLEGAWRVGAVADGERGGVLRLGSEGVATLKPGLAAHGPYACSNEITLAEGTAVRFDWRAERAPMGDSYDVLAYLLNTGTGETEILLNAWGDPAPLPGSLPEDAGGQDTGANRWRSVETTVPKDGAYRVVFISGSFDSTGGQLVGASLAVDNLVVEPAGGLTSTDGTEEGHIADARAHADEIEEGNAELVSNVANVGPAYVESSADMATECANQGGTWLEDFQECEIADETWCEANGGIHNGCASACRHDPSADVCIALCVQVCSFQQSSSNTPPTLTLLAPDGTNDTADQSYTIAWTDEAPDSDATISLYYDTDDTGADGALIVENLSEDDETDAYVWDTSEIPEDNYYIYAVIDDGTNQPVASYSKNYLAVDHIKEIQTKTFGGEQDDIGNKIIMTNHGNFILAGETSSQGAGNKDAYLIETDEHGNLVWEKTFGGTNEDRFKDVVQTTDGGYAAFGWSKSYGSSRGKFYLVKTDANGDEEWSQTYGHSDLTNGEALEQTTDGGYILAGNSTQTDAWLDFRLTKVDALGNEEWTKFFGRSQDDTPHDVKETSDGGYVITGLSGGWSASPKIWVVKTDASGDKIWDYSFGGANSDSWDRGFQVEELNDGNFVIVGNSYDSTKKQEVAIIKLDQNGNELWHRLHGSDENNYGRSFVILEDGTFIIAGYNEEDIYLLKVDNNGDLIWDRTIGNETLRERTYSIQHIENYLAMTGFVLSPETEDYDIYFSRAIFNKEVVVPMDFEHWNQTACIAGEETTEGLKIYGSAYRTGNYILSKDVYNFTDAELFVKWKPHGGGSYMAVGLSILSAVGAGSFTANHSFSGSKVVAEGTWYYSRIKINPDRTYEAVTATNNYDTEGGSIFESNSGTISEDRWPMVAATNIQIGLDDNYGSTNAYVVTGEVKTDAIKIDTNTDTKEYNFEDGIIPTEFSTVGEWGIVEIGQDSVRSLYVDNTNEDSFSFESSDAKAISFDLRTNNSYRGKQMVFYIDGIGKKTFTRGANNCWRNFTIGIPPTGAHTLKWEAREAGLEAWIDNIRLHGDLPSSATPTFTFTQPDGVNDTADQSYTITWTDEVPDADSDATIAFYYDTDNTGADGTLIVENLSEDDETDSHVWDTSQVPAGDYYLYGVIDDGVNDPVTVYSPGAVTIEHAPTQHFTPIWTGNPYNRMNLWIAGAMLDGMDLEAGDEIGIFDGENCVGVGVVEGAITQQDYLVITASMDDGSGNGFTEGNEIGFRVWDADTGIETDIIPAAAYADTATGDSITPPAFSADGDYIVELTALSVVPQTIDLAAGWNILSANVMPREDTELLNLLQPLIDAETLVKVIDEQGNTLIEFLGNWQNQIGDLAETEGYQIKVTENTSLDLAGVPTELPLAIPVSAGWNMISYPAQAPQNALDAVQPLMDAGSLVKVIDERGLTIVDFLGSWVNQIGNLAPGEGYKLKAAQDTTLTIDEGFTITPVALRAPARAVEQITPAHFTPVWSGNPYDRMNIWVTSATMGEADLAAGDEIGVFDGERCVGAGVVGATLSDENYLTIAASKDDGSGSGFAEGNGIGFRVWDSSAGAEIADVGSVYFDLDGNAIDAPAFTGNGDYITHLAAVSGAGADPVGETISLNRRNSVGLAEDGTAIVAVQGRDRFGAAAGVEDWRDLKQVSAGYNFTAGLKNDGTVVATSGWDERANRHSGKYMDAADWEGIEQISAGRFHILGVTTDGTLVAAGNERTYRKKMSSDGRVAASDFESVAESMSGVSAQDIISHLQEKDLLDETNSITADFMALDSYRDMNLGPLYRSKRRRIFRVLKNNVDEIAEWNNGILNNGDSSFVRVAAGDYHFAALRGDGTVVAAGKGGGRYDGVENWENITRVSAGVYHTVGIQGDGTIVATGRQGYRQADVDAWNASVAGGGSPFIRVSAGYLQTVALRADGTVAVSSRRETYDQVNNWTDIVEVSAGGSYVVGLTANDEILVDIGNSDGVDDHIHGKPLADWIGEIFSNSD